MPPPVSGTYATLLSDPPLANLFTDEAEIRALLDVERALARVQGRLGVIPAGAAAAIDARLASFAPAPDSLRDATAAAGVIVPGLVAAMREAVGTGAASFVHYGATSQDVIDTGLVLRLRAALTDIELRVRSLARALAGLAAAHRDTVLAARTRSQQATPTTLGLKIAGWIEGLRVHRARLAELRPRLLVVQLGGASGNLAALGGQGIAVMEALGAELALGVPAMPWHTRRDAVAELAGWCALVTGTLGKAGQDLVLLGQSEVGEVRAGAGGGSSTMPNKSNPVAAEMLIALARCNAGLVAGMHQAAIQEHERGGPGWTLEWLTLPRLVVGAGTALRHAQSLADAFHADPARMRANLDASDGLLLAEAASFALAAHMPRAEAQALVRSACAQAAAGEHLVDVLRARTSAPVDWERLRDPAAATGAAGELVDRVLAAHAASESKGSPV